MIGHKGRGAGTSKSEQCEAGSGAGSVGLAILKEESPDSQIAELSRTGTP